MKAAGAFSGLPRELRDNIPGPRLAIFKADKPSAGRQRERPAIRGDGRRPLLPERQRPAPIRYVHNGQLVGWPAPGVTPQYAPNVGETNKGCHPSALTNMVK